MKLNKWHEFRNNREKAQLMWFKEKKKQIAAKKMNGQILMFICFYNVNDLCVKLKAHRKKKAKRAWSMFVFRRIIKLRMYAHFGAKSRKKRIHVTSIKCLTFIGRTHFAYALHTAKRDYIVAFFQELKWRQDLEDIIEIFMKDI